MKQGTKMKIVALSVGALMSSMSFAATTNAMVGAPSAIDAQMAGSLAAISQANTLNHKSQAVATVPTVTLPQVATPGSNAAVTSSTGTATSGANAAPAVSAATASNSQATKNSTIANSTSSSTSSNSSTAGATSKANTSTAQAATGSSASVPFSNASNFKNLLSESVDPRTGIVSMSYPLISATGRGGLDLNLSLGYSMYGNSPTVNRYGLPTGWAFNLPFISAAPTNQWGATKQITFQDGSSYMLVGNTLKYYNLQDIVINTKGGKVTINGVSKPYELSIRYLNGDQDYFDQYGNLILEQDSFGNQISFSYTEQTQLASITDTYGNVYKFKYNTSGFIVTLPNGATTTMNYSTGNNTITLLDPVADKTVVQYETQNGMNVPKSISYSTGLTDNFEYQQLPYKTGSGTAYLPVVSTVTEDDKTDQVESTVTYQFGGASQSQGLSSTNNYMGYPTYTQSNNGSDPVMENGTNSFFYSTSQKLGNKLTVSKYDFLHLMTEQDTYDVTNPNQPVKLVEQDITYTGADKNGNMPAYSTTINANYQKPMQTMTRYFGSGSQERDVVENESYNLAGQQLTDQTINQVGNDTQTTTKTDVYDPTYGIMTEETVVGTDSASGITQETEQQNQLVGAGNSVPANSAIAATNSGVVDQGTKNFEIAKTTTYQYNPQGEVTQEIDGPGANATGANNYFGYVNNPAPLETDTTYEINVPSTGEETVITTEKGQSVSGQPETVTTQEVINTQTGLKLSDTDGNGNITTYTYDDLGRTTSETEPNGQVEQVAYESYSDAKGSGENSQIVTDPDGYIQKETYTGNGQVLAEYVNSSADHMSLTGTPTRQLELKTYNSLGQLTADEDVASGLTTSYVYDVLGRQIETDNPDGTKDFVKYNDYANTQTSYTLGSDGVSQSAMTVVNLDDANNQIQSTLTPSSN